MVPLPSIETLCKRLYAYRLCTFQDQDQGTIGTQDTGRTFYRSVLGALSGAGVCIVLSIRAEEC